MPPVSVSEIADGPTKAMIEIVRACNLRCPSCPVGNGLALRWPAMPFALYQEIINVSSRTLKQLSLFNYGEPLLCPEIDRYVDYAKRSGIKRVTIHTNGLLLSEDMGVRIITAGLDRLTISIDAVDTYAYNQYRLGGDFETLLGNIRQFMMSRNRLGKALPEVEGQFIVMAHNEHQMGKFADLCGELGLDVASIKTYNARMDLTHRIKHRELQPVNPIFSRAQGQVDSANTTRSCQFCSWPRNVLAVNADGTIVPCCYDYNNWNPLGSFPGRAQEEWWNTRRRRDFVQRLEQNPFSVSLCQKCPKGMISLSKSTPRSLRGETGGKQSGIDETSKTR
jgi:radical SAM protein with 4Fe4S-binding SPASM domain